MSVIHMGCGSILSLHFGIIVLQYAKINKKNNGKCKFVSEVKVQINANSISWSSRYNFSLLLLTEQVICMRDYIGTHVMVRVVTKYGK